MVATQGASARLTVLALLLGLLIATGLSLGAGDPLFHPLAGLRDWWHGRDSDARLVLEQLRLPRTLLALAIGAALGLSGCALQALLRNPIAEPGVLGVSSFAALGAVLAFYSGLSSRLPIALPLGGLAGAGASVTLLAALIGGRGTTALILAGAALSALAAALVALTLDLVPNPFAAYEITHWLMGSLTDRSLIDCALALPGIIVGCALLGVSARGLDALLLGEDVAASLGFHPGGWRGTQALVVGGTALAVGSSVAVAGAIGFVGLVVPHLLRPLIGHRPSRLLGPSALGGALLLLLADLLVRALSGTTEIAIGVLTALAGAPVFLWRVRNLRQEGT